MTKPNAIKGKDMKNDVLVTCGQKSFLRAKISVLSELCPPDQCNPHACVLDTARKTSLEKRLAWFDALNDEALRDIYTYCRLCMEVKDELD